MFWNANVLECECFGMRMVSAGCRRCRRCGRVLPGGQVPGMGELAGGSAREERIDVLEARMAELGVHDIQWCMHVCYARFCVVCAVCICSCIHMCML